MSKAMVWCFVAVLGCGGTALTPDGGHAGKAGGGAAGHVGAGGAAGEVADASTSGEAGASATAGAGGASGVGGVAGAAGTGGTAIAGAGGTAIAGAGGSAVAGAGGTAIAGAGGSAVAGAGGSAAAGAGGPGGAGGSSVVGAGGTGGASGNAGAGGSGGVSGGTPVALCKQVVSTICMRLKSCNVLQNPATFDEAACERSENVEFGCDRASSPAFPDCLSDVQLVSCAGLFSPSSGLVLPPSCNDPVNSIPLSAAQSKCADLAAADCTRLFECSGVTPTANDLQSCQIQDYDSAGCGFAVDVGPTYSQCLQDLSNAPCPTDAGASVDGGVPSCNSAIVFVQ
jgi:hypothetical protein